MIHFVSGFPSVYIGEFFCLRIPRKFQQLQSILIGFGVSVWQGKTPKLRLTVFTRGEPVMIERNDMPDSLTARLIDRFMHVVGFPGKKMIRGIHVEGERVPQADTLGPKLTDVFCGLAYGAPVVDIGRYKADPLKDRMIVHGLFLPFCLSAYLYYNNAVDKNQEVICIFGKKMP